MFRLILTVLLFVLAACGETPSAKITVPSNSSSSKQSADASIPYAPTPDSDPFYAQPNPMPKMKSGTIIKSRSVQFAPLGLPLPNPAWQLQYMSTDMRGNPIAAIATVVQPLVPSAATATKPLLSLQFAINSAGLKCAPSHQVTGSYDNYNSQLEALEYLPDVLAFGWTLIFPDHLGPTSSFPIGRLAAPIVLDGIRAAEHFEPLGLAGVDTPVGMMGYSGGALATTWSAALQPKYAPELKIVGVAAAGLPANIEATVKAFEGTPFFNLAYAGVISVNRTFPQLLPPGLLSEKGVQAANAVKDGCLGGTTDGSASPSGKLADYTTVADVYNTPGAKEVLPQLSLPQVGEVPTADIYFYHQTLDELAPVGPVEKVVETWCALGAHIHFYKDLTGEHFSGAGTAVPSQYAYLVGRFSGATQPVVPSTTVSCN